MGWLENYWHWFVIGIIIIGVLVFQIFVFRRTRKRLSEFTAIFPENFKNDWIVDTVDGSSQFVLKAMKQEAEKLAKLNVEKARLLKDKAGLEKTIQRMEEKKLPYDECLNQLTVLKRRIYDVDDEISRLTGPKARNSYNRYFWAKPAFKTIIESINIYLKKNKGNSIDYHLIKDIVDRNCDAIEEEIQAQLPMPLYAGLAGTMSGVIAGVGYLWTSGGLNKLLSAGEDVASDQVVSSGATGIEAVLGGIALAMLASFVGILLTTIGSWKAKTAKVEVERGKQFFLSWLQQELLPTLKSGVDAEVGRITDNIKASNASFAENTTKLNATLSDINKAISGMTGMLRTLQGLNVVQIASANLQVYDKLKNCSDELGRFAEYITSLDTFIAKIEELSLKLGEADDRVHTIEEMGRYFVQERGNLERMKGVISSSIGEADANLKNSVAAFKESTSKSYQDLVNHNEEQKQALRKAIDIQQLELENKLKEKVTQLDHLADELKKLAPIKESIANFEKATKEQNRKIDDLTNSIRELARAKVEGGNVTGGKLHLPTWAKWMMIICGGLVGITCLAILVFVVLLLLTDLQNV